MYQKINFSCFEYIDGTYVRSLCNQNDLLPEKSQITSINGVLPEEYVISSFSIFKRGYDHKHKKPYRDKLLFNDAHGSPVKIKYLKADGTEHNITLFSDVYTEAPWDENYIANTFFDDTNIYYNGYTYSYFKINNCNVLYGEEVKQQLEQCKSDKVILDFRDNYGGNRKFCSKYIYPYLFSQNISTDDRWYIRDTKTNKDIFENFFTHLIINFHSTENENGLYSKKSGYLYAKNEYSYKGKLTSNKKVFVLTSKGTGSAADRFVSTLKNNKLATIVGENTGGEGLMDSFLTRYMPNSKLAYIYMPSRADNYDGTDNSAYGTSPNIYKSLSLDGYYQFHSMLNSKKNPYAFENRLLWDDVLKEVISK